jgi:hypothetical protein
MKLILVWLERRVKIEVRRLRRQTEDKGLGIRCRGDDTGSQTAAPRRRCAKGRPSRTSIRSCVMSA